MSPLRVHATLVGVEDHHRRVSWPQGWPVPRVGETVELPGQPPLAVRTVVWYPEGDLEKVDPAEVSHPFVYVVIGPARPH